MVKSCFDEKDLSINVVILNKLKKSSATSLKSQTETIHIYIYILLTKIYLKMHTGKVFFGENSEAN